MATYEEIYGKRVKEFDSDPTLESSYEGQVWYDKSSGVLKSVVAFDAWSSSSSLGSARYDAGGTTGDYTNALLIAGYSTAFHANVEVWNGSSWTETTDISTAKADLEGAGTGTAGIAFGGRTPPNSLSATTEIFSSPTTSTVTFTVS